MFIARSSCLRSVVTLSCLSTLTAGAVASKTPQWIWANVPSSDGAPAGACYFRRTFVVDTPHSGVLNMAADDTFEAFVNGSRVGRGEQWKHLTKFDVTEHLVPGENAIAVKVVNRSVGAAGLVAKLVIQDPKSDPVTIVTDETWRTSLRPLPLWHRLRHADANWNLAKVLGPHGTTAPWIARPLPTARQIAAAKSPTKPARATDGDLAPPMLLPVAARQSILKRSRRRNSAVRLAGNNHVEHVENPLEQRFPWIADSRQSRVEPAADQALAQATISPERALPRAGTKRRKPIAADQHAVSPQEIPPSGPKPPGVADPPKPTVASPPSLIPRHNQAAPVPSGTEASAPRSTTPGSQTKDQATSQQFQTQRGFSVERLLGHRQTGSLISMSFNEFGQILAGREDGPLLLIVDTNQDNKPDEVQTYCDEVKNCQGILALSGMVFVVADGPEGTGLYRLSDEDRDGTLENVKALALFEVSASEHGPHGVVLGPDGNLYVVVGNHAKLKEPFAKLSARRHLYEGDLVPRYEDPGGHANGIRSPGGFVLRTDINGRRKELFASGLRNAYDLAFSAGGQLFTYDSDMESDQGTTWYRPTRLYHVVPGAEFGWRSGWAKWPSYYHDVVPPVAETGRGSPTGVVFYQHQVYPDKYRNAVFLADWSEGRILAARLNEDGTALDTQPEVFLEGTPLNVCDLEVGPDGALYFVTGGRGTRGNLCRVVWDDAGGHDVLPTLAEVRDAVVAPQLHSSWTRQQIATVRRKLGAAWAPEIRAAAANRSLSSQRRLQTLQIMQWVGPVPDAELLMELSRDADSSIRRMAAFLMSGSKDGRIPARLVELLSDQNDTVKRQACDSLVRSHKSVAYEYVMPLLRSDDRTLTWAARRLLGQNDPAEWQDKALGSSDIRVFIQASTVLMTAKPTKQRALQVVDRSRIFLRGFVGDTDFVDLLRLLQLAVLQGALTAADVPELAAELADEFPAEDHLMNRELIRLLVKLQVTSIADRYLEHLANDLPSIERIHLVSHLRFLNVPWTTDQKMQLFKYMEVPHDVGNSVPGYLQNIARDFGKRLEDDERDYALQHGAEYPSAAMAAVLRLSQKLSPEQVRRLIELDNSLVADNEATRRLKVAIVATLARDGRGDSMKHLRDVYDRDPQRRMEVVIGLAEQPAGDNWEYLVRSLPLLDGSLAREILVKLRGVDHSPRESEPYRQVIITGLRLGEKGGDDAVGLLEHWRGFASTAETPPWKEALAAWQKWFVQTYPNQPLPRLEVGSGGGKWDYDALLKHLQGDGLRDASAQRGKAIFVRAECAKCHRHGDLGEPMGPDLSTVGKRFLTKEILDSIIYPSRVISDQYKAKTIVTSDGQTHTGIVGFGGNDDLLILRPDGTKVRVPRAEVEQTVPSQVSAMPEGLLNSLSLDEISDLVAFLKATPPEMVTQRP